MCELLAEETERWRALILALTPEQLDAPRLQFNGRARGVRNFVCHMVQNSVYKHGQLATLFFALGLDGAGPYTAPFPNELYRTMGDAEPPEAARIPESA
jgi:hypothetical protein